jgi:hypothetical protein
MGSNGAAVVLELLEKPRTDTHKFGTFAPLSFGFRRAPGPLRHGHSFAVGENNHLRSHGLVRAEICIDRTLVIRVFNRSIFLAFHLLTGITGNVDAHVVI